MVKQKHLGKLRETLLNEKQMETCDLRQDMKP